MKLKRLIHQWDTITQYILWYVLEWFEHSSDHIHTTTHDTGSDSSDHIHTTPHDTGSDSSDHTHTTPHDTGSDSSDHIHTTPHDTGSDSSDHTHTTPQSSSLDVLTDAVTEVKHQLYTNMHQGEL